MNNKIYKKTIIPISIFPEMFAALNFGPVRIAKKKSILNIAPLNLRDFAQDKRKTVDDKPYGGLAGMVMMYTPIKKAITLAKQKIGHDSTVIHMSPQGKKITQKDVLFLSNKKNIIILCSRYRGVDKRVIDKMIDIEYSIGDYILSGGEIPAMALIDAIARTIPGVLGNNMSQNQDSFSNKSCFLDCPVYTRPSVIDGMHVPEVLMSGNHDAISAWIKKTKIGNTWERNRQNLLKEDLSVNKIDLLLEYINEKADTV